MGQRPHLILPDRPFQSVEYTGRVSEGFGHGTRLLVPFQDACRAYFGADICPGTLNVTLDRPVLFAAERSLDLVGEDGRRAFGFWPARLHGTSCLVRRWRACPLHVVELVAPVHLRTRLGLSTGDRARVEIGRDDTMPVGLRRRIAWAILWRSRRHRYYTDPEYVRTVERLNPRACALASQPLRGMPEWPAG